MIRTWRRIFPGLFKPLSAMPADLRQHIRYPEDLFLVQAQLYRAYHMDTPEVFYNREDLWQFPRQHGGLDRGTETAPPRLVGEGLRDSPRMAPYYMIMRLPGEARAELVLMLPMVPNQRDNMIAWLAVRCDRPTTASCWSSSFPRTSWSTGRSRSRRASSRTPRSRSRFRCGTRWARGSSAAICWWCRSRTRSCTSRRYTCAPRAASCRS